MEQLAWLFSKLLSFTAGSNAAEHPQCTVKKPAEFGCCYCLQHVTCMETLAAMLQCQC